MAAICRRRLILLLLIRRGQRRAKLKYRKRYWVSTINQNRTQQGEYTNLIRKMHLGDHESFFKYFGMSPVGFEKLLHLVAPLIVRSDQNRESIKPAERLAVTLRYLATGDSHQIIAFNHRLGHSTVNKFVADTCKAIWSALSPISVH